MIKEVKIEITNLCSRNCKHCSSSATNCLNNIKTLTYDNVERIIYQASEMGVTDIVFTGGEPTLYDDLDKLILLATSLGVSSTIYTFAYRTDENFKLYEKLIANGLTKIVYSLADTLSDEEDISIYSTYDFFDTLLKDKQIKLGFHYAISKDSIDNFEDKINSTLESFKNKNYFDKISLLRFVPHGKGTEKMDLTRDELIHLKSFFEQLPDKNKIRLGSPWNILGISNSPCIIADEVMIIGFDGIAYPCDSIKYFTELGISGNIQDNTLQEMYDSEYFNNIRNLKVNDSCSNCSNYSICKSGCIGQKIIANYFKDDNGKVLRYCNDQRDPKCLW